ALLGAVLLPVAIRAGLPALGVAMAMNLFGHGIALSSDFIIQGAPKLTADAAGLPVGDVISASIPLVITVGVVPTAEAFWRLERALQRDTIPLDGTYGNGRGQRLQPSEDLLAVTQEQGLGLLLPVGLVRGVLRMAVFDVHGGG